MVGVDPGLVGTGWAVVERGTEGPTVVDVGVVATPAGLPLPERLQRIYEGVAGVLDAHAPELLVLEELYSEYRFPRTALLMAHARGVICLAARQRGIEVLGLAPAEVKRVVTANGAAPKPQVQLAVRRLFGLTGPLRSPHAADALALAFAGVGRRAPRPQPTSP